MNCWRGRRARSNGFVCSSRKSTTLTGCPHAWKPQLPRFRMAWQSVVMASCKEMNNAMILAAWTPVVNPLHAHSRPEPCARHWTCAVIPERANSKARANCAERLSRCVTLRRRAPEPARPVPRMRASLRALRWELHLCVAATAPSCLRKINNALTGIQARTRDIALGRIPIHAVNSGASQTRTVTAGRAACRF